MGGLLERGEVPAQLRREVRARRARSPSYLTSAGEKIRKSAPSAAKALAFRARDMLRKCPGSPNYIAGRREAGWLMWRLGEREEAAKMLDDGDISFATPQARAVAVQLFKTDLANLLKEDAKSDAASRHAESKRMAEGGDLAAADLLRPAELHSRTCQSILPQAPDFTVDARQAIR